MSNVFSGKEVAAAYTQILFLDRSTPEGSKSVERSKKLIEILGSDFGEPCDRSVLNKSYLNHIRAKLQRMVPNLPNFQNFIKSYYATQGTLGKPTKEISAAVEKMADERIMSIQLFSGQEVAAAYTQMCFLDRNTPEGAKSVERSKELVDRLGADFGSPEDRDVWNEGYMEHVRSKLVQLAPGLPHFETTVQKFVAEDAKAGRDKAEVYKEIRDYAYTSIAPVVLGPPTNSKAVVNAVSPPPLPGKSPPPLPRKFKNLTPT